MSESGPGPLQPGEALYRATLARWGERAQYDQMVEECAELIIGLKHYQRDRLSADAVIDELADVSLMLGQLSYMFGDEKVAAAVERKLAKLQRLLGEDEGEREK